MTGRAPERPAAHDREERVGLLETWAQSAIRSLGIAIAASGILVACGGGGDSKITTAPKDTTPPEINTLSATLGNGSLDLSKSDDQRVIVTPTQLTLKVFATDDVTAPENLTVQALDDSNKPLGDQSATLHNGLWQVTTTVNAGLTVHVAVSDEAGNQTLWPYAAVFPTREQALARKWTLIVYDNQKSPTGVYPVINKPVDTLTADTWCQEDDAAGNGPAGGTWSVLADGRLKLETRDHTACDSADLTKPVQATRLSDFYVDQTDYSDRPYTRQGGTANDITGSWSYKVELTSGGQTQTVTATLELNGDKTFTRKTEDGHTLQGTYEQLPNPNYSANYGQLLVLTVDKKDGATLPTPVVQVHYFTVTQDLQLLVDPLVQVQ